MSTKQRPPKHIRSLSAASPRSLERQARITVAPMSASCAAVALPMPEFAPVTMTIFPFIFPSMAMSISNYRARRNTNARYCCVKNGL